MVSEKFATFKFTTRPHSDLYVDSHFCIRFKKDRKKEREKCCPIQIEPTSEHIRSIPGPIHALSTLSTVSLYPVGLKKPRNEASREARLAKGINLERPDFVFGG